MTGILRILLAAALLLAPLAARAADPENIIYMDVPAGRVVIEMHPELAPLTVAHIKALVRRGFYDGIAFHRVIPGFMAQTGDPRGDGSGGSGETVKAEFSRAHHHRGTVSMARLPNDVNSADSQFFICYADLKQLDGQYTIWGEVISGMEYIDRIKQGDPALNGKVDNPDRIIRMQIAADADKKQ
jgi:peptidylprolyl isomerase